MPKKSIYDLTHQAMKDQFNAWGFSSFKADQLFNWLYRKKISDFDLMSDMSKAQKSLLNDTYGTTTLHLVERQQSKDGTVKYLFAFDDAKVECVRMHYHFGYSVCISSQVGCNMGCKFCASGLLKKQRNLTAGEMVQQVLYVAKELEPLNERVKNIVIMGTGEPFDNYENVMDFCAIVNHPKGLEIGARHITISTCGIVPKIRLFADQHHQYNLAISLHAPTNALRDTLMPVNHAYPLEELMDALSYYASKNNRKITFEYILLRHVNDIDEHAIALAKLVKGLCAYVNLIPYNAVDENGFQGVDMGVALRFYDVLMKHGVKATLRARHGDDIDAACGQLRAKREGVFR